jgi:hypothetical protein
MIRFVVHKLTAPNKGEAMIYIIAYEQRTIPAPRKSWVTLQPTIILYDIPTAGHYGRTAGTDTNDRISYSIWLKKKKGVSFIGRRQPCSVQYIITVVLFSKKIFTN